MHSATSLRPTQSDDLGFLYDVYASTRFEELEQTPWSDDQKAAFLRMQFDAQHQWYHGQFADAQYQVIELDGVPVGRLYVERTGCMIHVIDIALLPEYRNRGIGGAHLRALMDEAAQAGMPLRIFVETFNPARRLYDRLGFRVFSEHGVHLQMEWKRNGTA